ncbi:flippase [Halobacteriales archaeon Cl-PHB]
MDRRSELSTLLSSAGLVMVGAVIASGSKLLERVVIGRLLTPAAYGEVAVGIALLTFGVTIAVAGLSQGVPRFLSRYEDERDRRGTWATGLAIATGLALLLAATLFVAAEQIVGLLFETRESLGMLHLFIAAIPFVVAQKIAIGAIRGHENTIYRTYTKDLLYPLGRIGLVAVLLASGYGIVAAGYAYLAAAVATCLLAHVLLHRLMPLTGPFRTHTRDLVTFSLPLVVSTVLSVLLTRTDTLMVAYFRGSREVGLYNAAYPIAGGLLLVLSAFGFLYLPMASRLDSDGDRTAVADIYQTTTKWIYVVTFPAFVTFTVFPADVIELFFGPSYAAAAPALPILVIGFFLSAAVGRNRETLSALGDTNLLMVANGVGFTLNVALNFVLIPRYGFVGAAVTSALSFATVHGVVCSVLWYRYGITPLTPESLKTFVALPAVLLPLAFLVAEVVTVTAVTLVPVLVIVGVASLVVVAAIGGLEPDDTVALEVLEEAMGVELRFAYRYFPNE